MRSLHQSSMMAALFLKPVAFPLASLHHPKPRRIKPSFTRLQASTAEPSSKAGELVERGRRRQTSEPILEVEMDEQSELRSWELAAELESMEEEVMMGGDDGREPVDYDRRARLFDKSSRVFRALKGRSSEP